MLAGVSQVSQDENKLNVEIVYYPHPALNWKSKPITEINAKLRSTVSEMFELMYDARGIGLAANQVALPLRLFVVNVTADPDEKDEEFVFINPEITRRKGSVEGEEGCLSLPEVYGPVVRAEQIVVEAFDLKGEGFEMKLNDLPARAVQHEYDHIEGVMFFDRMSPAAKDEIDPYITRFEEDFQKQQAAGVVPTTEEISKTLRDLEPS